MIKFTMFKRITFQYEAIMNAPFHSPFSKVTGKTSNFFQYSLTIMTSFIFKMS